MPDKLKKTHLLDAESFVDSIYNVSCNVLLGCDRAWAKRM